jgi:hypothetical protein
MFLMFSTTLINNIDKQLNCSSLQWNAEDVHATRNKAIFTFG